MNCVDCGGLVDIPSDALKGEIIGCGACGLDYILSNDEKGTKFLEELVIEGEDWGE